MSDLVMLAILALTALMLYGLVLLCEMARLMNALDLLTAAATVFAFAYLFWALLRPEDF